MKVLQKVLESKAKHPLAQDDPDLIWLQDLNSEISKIKETYSRVYGPGALWSQNRQMTAQEWERVKQLIATYSLPCELTNVNFGFDVAIGVYNHGHFFGDRPEVIMFISSKQLPEHAQSGPTDWEITKREFEPLVYAEQNLRLLSYYGLELPKEDIKYYDY